MKWETVIGLEVHAELATKSKIFCSCVNEFGGEPNSHCCPICSGHPGVLPVLNRKAVELTVKAGLALGCEISRFSKFDRKNYYYPDLPKAYQTSQFDLPLCKNGCVEVKEGDGNRKIRINRIHLEEDAGKLIHSETGSGTLVDYNRCGVPLIEIVTEPDFRSPEQALEFLEKVKAILSFAGVSDCRMEQGSLRCDVNLSLRPMGSEEYGTRTEMKNVNSFRAAYRAMQYEQSRQQRLLNEGKTIGQETRRWDDVAGKSYVMRTKEDAHDYRYFPEPDLVPVRISERELDCIRATLPELPAARKARYLELGLPDYDADILTQEAEISDFFDRCLLLGGAPKTLSNWIMSDLLRKRKETESNVAISPEQLVGLIALCEKGEISQSAGKTVFEALWGTSDTPESVVEKAGLRQNNDEGELLCMVRELIANNPRPVADYRAGNKKAMAFFVGQIMKASRGKANPKLLNELLEKELNS